MVNPLDFLSPYKYAIIGASALALVGGFFGYGQKKWYDGRSFGVQQERVVWEEARRKMLARQAELRKMAQADLDALEKEYLDYRKTSSDAMVALREEFENNPIIIEVEPEEEEKEEDSDATEEVNEPRPVIIRPFIPRRFAVRLNQIGRARN